MGRQSQVAQTSARDVPTRPLGAIGKKKLCNIGSLPTDMSNHSQIATEEQEDRLTDTH